MGYNCSVKKGRQGCNIIQIGNKKALKRRIRNESKENKRNIINRRI